ISPVARLLPHAFFTLVAPYEPACVRIRSSLQHVGNKPPQDGSKLKCAAPGSNDQSLAIGVAINIEIPIPGIAIKASAAANLDCPLRSCHAFSCPSCFKRSIGPRLSLFFQA